MASLKFWGFTLRAAIVFVGAGLGGCSSTVTQEGTNTNWVTCTTTADCTKASASATCQGGLCKTPDGGLVQQTLSSTSACSWSPTLDGDASSRATCHASRTLVSCDLPGGGGTTCVTNGEITCGGSSNSPCHSVCATNEYAATCGGVGPGPYPNPPAGCQSAALTPAGYGFYCCPCE